MKAGRRHHRRRRSTSREGLQIDDGRVEGIDECRAVFWSDDGTVIDVGDGREVLKSRLHGGVKTTLTSLLMAAALLLCIPVGVLIAKFSILVLDR